MRQLSHQVGSADHFCTRKSLKKQNKMTTSKAVSEDRWTRRRRRYFGSYQEMATKARGRTTTTNEKQSMFTVFKMLSLALIASILIATNGAISQQHKIVYPPSLLGKSSSQTQQNSGKFRERQKKEKTEAGGRERSKKTVEK